MKAILWIALGFGMAVGQTPKLEFEVAAIKPAQQDGDHDSETNHGFFKTHNLTLKQLMVLAYEVDMKLISGGPSWIDSDSYDINAKIPEPFDQTRDGDAVRQMIQNLLADRFQLAVHRVDNEIGGYALVVVKKGAKLQAGDPNKGAPGFRSKNTHLIATNVTMANFAVRLSRNADIGKLVIDKTGLEGSYSFELDWAPEKVAANPGSTDDRPSIFSALPQQLGLRLEAAKIPVKAIVVDRAEKPQGN